MRKNDSDMIDGIVFDSEWCAEYIETEWYFRKKHGIASDARIIMFAPTFWEWKLYDRWNFRVI